MLFQLYSEHAVMQIIGWVLVFVGLIVMNELGRGVSSIEVTGEYTGDRRKQLKILCSPRESFIIKRYLAKEDPNSFVSVTSIKSVWGRGRGFSDIRDLDN